MEGNSICKHALEKFAWFVNSLFLRSGFYSKTNLQVNRMADLTGSRE